MKKKLIAVALLACLGTVSCKQENESLPSPISTTQTPNISSVSKTLFDFGADDAMGAMAGAGWGAAGGPWGSFCGGVALGCYMSVRDCDVIPNNSPVNPTQDDASGNIYVIAPNNPYEFIGNIHNKAMQYILEHSTEFYPTGSVTINMEAYYNWAIPYFASFPEFGNYMIPQPTFNTYVSDLTSFYNGSFIDGVKHFYDNNEISLDVKNSLTTYWSSLISYSNNQDRKNYYISYVDAVNASATFNNDEKKLLLSTAGVGMFSILYHSANQQQ